MIKLLNFHSLDPVRCELRNRCACFLFENLYSTLSLTKRLHQKIDT